MIHDETIAASVTLTAWLENHRDAPPPFGCYLYPSHLFPVSITWHADTEGELEQLVAATPELKWTPSEDSESVDFTRQGWVFDGDIHLTYALRAVPAQVTP